MVVEAAKMMVLSNRKKHVTYNKHGDSSSNKHQQTCDFKPSETAVALILFSSHRLTNPMHIF
jgi:hypothetical protein